MNSRSDGLQVPYALSLVIPVYNEERMLPALFRELSRVRRDVLGDAGPVEIVLVNDGSQDRSWEMIAAFCRQGSDCTGVNLSRNFGHQLALAAGLETARGDVVVSMDADLQDPPAVIRLLLEAHHQGYDVVHATRRTRGEESWLKAITARGFYWLMEKISGVALHRNTGDFRLLSRRAVTELSRLRETHRFLRGLVPWIGLPQTQVFYDRGDRAAGNSHYSLGKMLTLAMDGIVSMSVAPLRLAYFFGGLLFLVLSVYIGYELYHHATRGMFADRGVPLLSVIALFGVMQLLVLGILGEYVGRIFEQVKNRPLFVIQDVLRAERTLAVPAHDL